MEQLYRRLENGVIIEKGVILYALSSAIGNKTSDYHSYLRPVQQETTILSGLFHENLVRLVRDACKCHNQKTGECNYEKMSGELCYYNAGTPQSGSMKHCPYIDGLREPLKWELIMEPKRGQDPLILYPNLDNKGVNFDGKKIKITVEEVRE